MIWFMANYTNDQTGETKWVADGTTLPGGSWRHQSSGFVFPGGNAMPTPTQQNQMSAVSFRTPDGAADPSPASYSSGYYGRSIVSRATKLAFLTGFAIGFFLTLLLFRLHSLVTAFSFQAALSIGIVSGGILATMSLIRTGKVIKAGISILSSFAIANYAVLSLTHLAGLIKFLLYF